MDNAPFILVDGSSYLFRAYHALPPLTNSKGLPTGAIYGVVNMLRRLLKDYEPTRIAVVFDTKGKTFREDIYKEYKANRPSMPEELSCQIEPLHKLIKAMGLPLIAQPGVEADDVIGTLAHQATARGWQTIISTGDKDMAQLVNDKVSLINTMTGVAMDGEGVEEKFGVGPELIIDYLSLIGDKVDNVPGVPKVGPKTAVKWLSQYGDLDGILQHADDITGKVGENLREHAEFLPLARSLVTIKTDCEMGITLDDCIIKSQQQDDVIDWYKTLEFKTWLAEALDGDEASESQETGAPNYETILTEDALDEWIKKLRSAPLVAVDTETTSLNYMQAKLVGLSFSVAPNEAAYLPLAHDYEGAPEQCDMATALARLKPVLEDTNVLKVGHHLKYDKHILKHYDIDLAGIAFDTLLESYVLNSTGSRHDLDTLALKYLGAKTTHFEDIAGKGAKQKTFNQIELETAAHYAAEDADITLRLHQVLWPQLEQDKKLLKVFKEIELPLIDVLFAMEHGGVLIDTGKLSAQSQDISERLKTLEDKAYAIAEKTFNLASPKQLQTILFEELGLPVLKKTPKGQPSTAEEVLQELAHDYPLPKIILEHRSLSKLKSTYTDKLPEQIDVDTARVHTSYHQAVTATGRLSSTDPNLQNIPIRTEEGRKIRQAFIAPPGHQIVAADYSQIELRIMAHLSQDAGLLTAFANGQDVHTATAAEVFGVSIDDVTSDHRRSAKAINFGLIYGMSAFGLARQLGIERHMAERYIEVYFERYPGVRDYMDNTRALAKSQGYIETLFGRRLYLPEINAQNKMRQQAAERQAINGPMQGTAADIIKIAMVKVQDWLQASSINARMLMQVHDELVFEVAEGDRQALTDEVTCLMSEAAQLDVPLLVEVGSGDNWDEAH